MMIPTYSLYGEQREAEWENFFNFEHIPLRSKMHGWNIPPHIHRTLMQMLYIRQGSVEVVMNNTKKMAYAPCFLLIPAGTVHSLHYSEDVDGPVITVSQRPVEQVVNSLMPNLLQVIRTPKVYGIKSHINDKSFMKGFWAIEREFLDESYGHFATNVSLFITLLVRLLRITSEPAQTIKLPERSRKTAIIDKFLLLLGSKERAHLSVEHYADEVGVTPGHLSRLCREVMGVSCLEVINKRVIEEAQRDLIYTSLSVKQLADSLGFSDEAYFTRFFTKHMGLSPKKFRDMAVKEIYQDMLPS